MDCQTIRSEKILTRTEASVEMKLGNCQNDGRKIRKGGKKKLAYSSKGGVTDDLPKHAKS